MEVLTIIFIIALVCVAYSIDKHIKSNKTRQNIEKEYNAETFIVTKHIIGLPLAEQSLCRVFLCKDKIIIKSIKNENIFNLAMEKILDVNIKTEQEIQNSYTSSIGGAIGGAVIAGPLGAMLGGRTKKKVDKIVRSYLIFTYNNEKENKVDYISFDVTGDFKAHKFVDYFSKNCKRNIVTDL